MQTANLRYFSLTFILLAATGVYAALGTPLGAGTPRWPTVDSLYVVDNWFAGPERVEQTGQTNIISRTFRQAKGASATLTMVTNQAPKLYGAGAEVPFLGNGFTVEHAPPDVPASGIQGVSGLMAQRAGERWLVMYAYGERRGLLGNGPMPWALALSDGILARPNDYYKLYLMASADQVNQHGSEVVGLASALFPRIAAWYGA
jgi:hypothetical protein